MTATQAKTDYKMNAALYIHMGLTEEQHLANHATGRKLKGLAWERHHNQMVDQYDEGLVSYLASLGIPQDHFNAMPKTAQDSICRTAPGAVIFDSETVEIYPA